MPDNDIVYPPTQATYYRRLQEVGYHVGIVGKTGLHGADRPISLDGRKDDNQILGFHDAFHVEGKIESFINGFGDPKGPYLKHFRPRSCQQVSWRVGRYIPIISGVPRSLDIASEHGGVVDRLRLQLAEEIG